MIPEKLMEVLKYEGVVSIVSQSNEAHVANTWNSYLKVTDKGEFLIPAGRMNETEENLKANKKVLLTMGSRDVEGFHSMGTGFLVEGEGAFLYEGENFDLMKEKFPWMRAVLLVQAKTITQTL